MAGKSKESRAGSAPKLPRGLRILEGNAAARKPKVALVVSRFNSRVTDHLLAGAVGVLKRHGAAPKDITVARVPGAVELPIAAKALAMTGKYDAVVALGCVIRGDTTHYDYVCSMAAQGVLDAALDTGVPVIFGVLTTENLEQALERAEINRGDKGGEAALAALEMADLLGRIW
ncbi:MAG TPA: 6,7-dimethyl-8-ribityllumazine synthase [Fibrobacteria bacterium]|nr:6,7-dimethyl-8-ribityllumazine synthase [Fibrobacteria bacterium]